MTPRECKQLLIALKTMQRLHVNGQYYVPVEFVRAAILAFEDSEASHDDDDLSKVSS